MTKMPIVSLPETAQKLGASGKRVDVLWQHEDSLVFMARGREYRSEFHINPSDEVMYPVKGDLRLHYRNEDGKEEVAVVPEGSVIYTPAGHAAFAAFRPRFISPGDGAQAPRRRGRPFPMVLPELRRAAARGALRRRRLSRRSGVEGVSELLRQRGGAHLQALSQRHAEAVGDVSLRKVGEAHVAVSPRGQNLRCASPTRRR